MRIALVAPETLPLPPRKGGAVQIYIDALIPFLAKKHSITLFSPADGANAGNYGPNVKHLILPQNGYLKHVAKHLTPGRFHIVHIFNRPEFVPPLHSVSPTSRFILNLHNDPAPHVRKKLRDKNRKLWCSKVDKVITNSKYTKSVTLKNFPSLAGKINTVHLGVDTKKFFPRKRFLRKKRKTILFIGRLHRNKGLHLLILAAAKLTTKHPDILLLVVGGSKHGTNRQNQYTRYVYRLAKKKLGKGIRFTGFLNPQKIPYMYRRSDIFVCPSIWQEPFGRVNLEAMASGLPVVTSRKGGIPEAVIDGETGYLVKHSNRPSNYAAKIEKLLSDYKLRKRMGRAGRIRIQRTFTWERVAAKIADIYKSVAGV